MDWVSQKPEVSKFIEFTDNYRDLSTERCDTSLRQEGLFCTECGSSIEAMAQFCPKFDSQQT